MFEKISTKLKAILEANDLIQEVHDFEASELSGSPVAIVIPSGNESDFSSTTENRRTYGFVIRLYVDRLSGNTNERETETTMRELVDTVLDDLDKDYQLSGLDVNTGYCLLWSSASPSAWGYAGRENIYRVAEITVSVHFDVDTELIN